MGLKNNTVHSPYVPKGQEIHGAFTQQMLVKHTLRAGQGGDRQPFQHAHKIVHLFCAFTNTCLKRFNVKCHRYFDRPQKKFNHLRSRINMTQGFQDPEFSREYSKLTGSSQSSIGHETQGKTRSPRGEEPHLRPFHIGRTSAVAQEGRLHLPQVNCELLSKLAPQLRFPVARVPSK